MIKYFIVMLTFCCFANSSVAQNEFSFSADELQIIDQTQSVIATGEIEFDFDNQIIRSDRVEYNDGILIFSEPIEIALSDGTVYKADSAELNSETRKLILKGFRTLIDDQVQVVADSATHYDQKYIRLSNVIVTGCAICSADDRPIWYFYAGSLIIPTDAERIYLFNSKFIIGNQTILTLPRHSVPHPKVDRVSGFLFPRFAFSSSATPSIKLPYYMTLGDHADITLTPGITTKGQSGLALEYRGRYRSGWINFNGSFGVNDPNEKLFKKNLIFDTEWKIGNTTRFSLLHTSKSDIDDQRLKGVFTESKHLLFAETYSRNENNSFNATFIKGNPGIGNEAPDTFEHLANLSWQHNLTWGYALPEILVTTQLQNIKQNELTKNVSRASIQAEINERFILGPGIVSTFTLIGSLDTYRWKEDQKQKVRKSEQITNYTGAVDFSWPLIRHENQSVTMIEPFIQVVYSPEQNNDYPYLPVPYTEFDITNIRSLDRFTGNLHNESRLRVNLGTKLIRQYSNGYSFEFMVGKVLASKKLDKGLLDRLDTDHIKIDSSQFRSQIMLLV